MEDSSFERIENETEFVLVNFGDFSAFLTRCHFRMAIRHFFARDYAETWGDLRVLCGAEFWDFCSPFIEGDPSDYRPCDDDLLEEIQDEIWILYDGDFPMMQFAEETTTLHGSKFPTHLRSRVVRTEYGHDIDLYPSEDMDRVLKEAKATGLSVECLKAEFPR